MAGRHTSCSWSFSRASCFESCPRQYYYRYYGWRGDLDDPAAEPERKVRFLKELTGIWAWAGFVVHAMIHDAIGDAAAGYIAGVEELQARARQALSSQWKSSLDHLDHRQERRLRLAEQYYQHFHGEPDPTRQAPLIRQRVNDCLENFCTAGFLERFSRLPRADWVYREGRTDAPVPSFAHDGVKVYARIDLAVREDSQTVVYDWKTGRQREKDSRQLACYALYVQAARGIPATAIATTPVYLLQPGPWPHEPVTQARIDETVAYLEESVADLRNCLADPARNLALIGDFPTRPHPGRCRNCNFREICPGWEEVRSEALAVKDEDPGALGDD